MIELIRTGYEVLHHGKVAAFQKAATAFEKPAKSRQKAGAAFQMPARLFKPDSFPGNEREKFLKKTAMDGPFGGLLRKIG